MGPRTLTAESTHVQLLMNKDSTQVKPSSPACSAFPFLQKQGENHQASENKKILITAIGYKLE